MTTQPARIPGTSHTVCGQVVGGLLFLHLTVGLILPFVLLDPLIARPGFLDRAAQSSTQMRTAVFLLFIGSALAIAVTSAGWAAFRASSSTAALWLSALAIASFTLQIMDNGNILSMLSLSQRYAEADPANHEVFQSLAIITGNARKWAHYWYLLTIGCWIVLFFTTLFRFRLAPRWLAAAGIIAALMQVAGVSVRGLLGLPPETRLAMPLAPIYAGMALYLLVRGFSRPQAQPNNPQDAL